MKECSYLTYPIVHYADTPHTVNGTRKKRTRIMSESKIQVSFKLPNGTIPLFRGDTVEEVQKLVEVATLSENFIGTLDAFAEAAGINKSAPVITQTQAMTNVSQALGASVISINGAAPTRHCLHGKMTAIEGNGQYGLYKGFFCAAPKGATDKCPTIWVR